MRDIAPELAAVISSDTPTLSVCWLIEKGNGETIRGTDHDRDIVVAVEGSPTYGLAGRYRARANITGSATQHASDLSPDNMEVEGATEDEVTGEFDVSVAEIEAGVLDRAPVTVFVVDWRNPDAGQLVIKRGWLGEILRDSDQRYRTEVRGLTQALSQNIGQTFAERCNVVELGDSRCRFNVQAVTRSGQVGAVTSRRQFVLAVTPSDEPPVATYWNGGKVRGITGANAGFTREVKRAVYSLGGVTVELWEEMPDDVAVLDVFELVPGCDRLLATCRDVFANVDNFRGFGVFAPGRAALIKGPT